MTEHVKKNMEEFWGEGHNDEDYRYLEKELANWEKRYKDMSYTKLVLIKEVCHKQNWIRKNRRVGHDVSTDVAKLLSIMEKLVLF